MEGKARPGRLTRRGLCPALIGAPTDVVRAASRVTMRFQVFETTRSPAAPFGAERAPVLPSSGAVSVEAGVSDGTSHDRRRLASRVHIADDGSGRRTASRSVLSPGTP